MLDGREIADSAVQDAQRMQAYAGNQCTWTKVAKGHVLEAQGVDVSSLAQYLVPALFTLANENQHAQFAKMWHLSRSADEASIEYEGVEQWLLFSSCALSGTAIQCIKDSIEQHSSIGDRLAIVPNVAKVKHAQFGIQPDER